MSTQYRKKNYSGIGSIKRISHCVPPATLHNIYHGLVHYRASTTVVLFGPVTMPKRYPINYRDFKIGGPLSYSIQL